MGMPIEKIGAIILIVIVAVFLILIPTKGWSIVKYVTNYNIGEVSQAPPTEITNQFKLISTDFGNCFNSKNNNCLCNTHIQLFPERYFITFDTEIIDFRRILPGFDNGYKFTSLENSIAFKQYVSFKGKNINCYVEYDSNTGLINTKIIGKTSYLLLYTLTGIVTTEGTQTTSHSFLNNKPTFYKFKNEICFVLEDKLVKKGQDYINNLPKC